MSPEKEQYYESATKKLLETIDSMDLNKAERLQAKNLVLLFRDSFKLPDVKRATFSKITDIKYFTYDSDGFCRASSIDFALMMGGNPNWRVKYINDIWTYGPHHFLMHMPSKTILDLTYDQYTNTGITIPYEMGYFIPYSLEPYEAPMRFAEAIGIKQFITFKNQKY